MGKSDKAEKTNVVRVLDKLKIEYNMYTYNPEVGTSGLDVAKSLSQDPAKVFKTLVTVGKTGNHYVFSIPVGKELDLKKAAQAVKEKNIEMIPQKELLPLTGYIHGGCSPIGMKKFFTTTFDVSLNNLDTVIFSGGKIGYQVEITPDNLSKVIKYGMADVTV